MRARPAFVDRCHTSVPAAASVLRLWCFTPELAVVVLSVGPRTYIIQPVHSPIVVHGMLSRWLTSHQQRKGRIFQVPRRQNSALLI